MFTATGAMLAQNGGDPWLMRDGRVLLQRFGDGDDEVYDPVNGAFAPSGAANSPTADSILLLGNGRALFLDSKNRVSVYDAADGKLSAPALIPDDRIDFGAVALANGRVLLLGSTGNPGAGYPTSADIYDPATGKVTKTGSMREGRDFFTATLLTNGKVLIAGGSRDDQYRDTTFLSTAELYDPTTGKFDKTGSIEHARDGCNATLLQDGRVLIAGGMDNAQALASAEIYDPETGKFTATGSMSAPRVDFSSTLLSDGRVLVAGGSDVNGPYSASADIYNPATSKFTPTGSMLEPRGQHDAFLMPDGRVLIFGGRNDRDFLATAELYLP